MRLSALMVIDISPNPRLAVHIEVLLIKTECTRSFFIGFFHAYSRFPNERQTYHFGSKVQVPIDDDKQNTFFASRIFGSGF